MLDLRAQVSSASTVVLKRHSLFSLIIDRNNNLKEENAISNRRKLLESHSAERRTSKARFANKRFKSGPRRGPEGGHSQESETAAATIENTGTDKIDDAAKEAVAEAVESAVNDTVTVEAPAPAEHVESHKSQSVGERF